MFYMLCLGHGPVANWAGHPSRVGLQSTVVDILNVRRQLVTGEESEPVNGALDGADVAVSSPQVTLQDFFGSLTNRDKIILDIFGQVQGKSGQ